MAERPTCEARIGKRQRADGWGTETVYCKQQVGLRQFTGDDRKVHRYCPIEGHQGDVVRRYGVAEGTLAHSGG